MIRELWAVYKVLRWHKKTFPNVTYKEQTAKRRDEIHEWIDALISTPRIRENQEKPCRDGVGRYNHCRNWMPAVQKD